MIETLSDTIAVLTSRNAETLIGLGGTLSWKLNPARAIRCKYVLCCQNAEALEDVMPPCRPTEPHGSAFLIGKVSGIVRTPDPSEGEDRWMVTFNEFARLSIPNVWGSWRTNPNAHRNPYQYVTLAQLGIDPEGAWEPVPSTAALAQYGPAALKAALAVWEVPA